VGLVVCDARVVAPPAKSNRCGPMSPTGWRRIFSARYFPCPMAASARSPRARSAAALAVAWAS